VKLFQLVKRFSRKDGDLLSKIADTKVSASAKDMVKTLQHDIDIVTIAHLLATIVQEEIDVKGKDIIGLGTEEVKALIERAKNFKGGDRNRSGGRGRSRNRSRSGGRNRDRGGREGDRRGGGDKRSSGGNRDSRNGGSSRNSRDRGNR